MIPHEYTYASENPAQWHADQIDRQEVTADWYLEHMCDAPLFRWVDGQVEYNLDPWRLCDMVPDFECRLFVQRRDYAAWGVDPAEHGVERGEAI